MHIQIVTPAPRGSRYGNRTTALRWARLLREAGHRVDVHTTFGDDSRCDVLIALHARRSAESVRHAHEERPGMPILLCLTGTDVYQDIQTDADAQLSMEVADRLLVLQPLAEREVPSHLRHKVRPVIQSATQTPGVGPTTNARSFDVAVVGHLRDVKDPMRTALASRLLPPASRIRVLHVGGAMEPEYEEAALAEMKRNPRYRWLGELPRWRVRRVMKRSQLLVLTSKLEGGANVVSEALADGVPVISSDIDGSKGLLGEDYPGIFPVGDTQALATLLERVENDPAFLEDLRRRCRALTPTVLASAERATLVGVVDEVCC